MATWKKHALMSLITQDIEPCQLVQRKNLQAKNGKNRRPVLKKRGGVSSIQFIKIEKTPNSFQIRRNLSHNSKDKEFF